MRGDSVRDLYSKALALLGLAVLAGAGALVDYWPVQGSLPGVSFTYSLPPGPAALDVRVALASRVELPVARPRAAAPVAVATAVSEPAPVEMSVVTVAVDEPVAAPVVAQAVPDVVPVPPVPEPVQIIAAVEPPVTGVFEPLSSSKPQPEDVVLPSSSNPLQKAGGHMLNAGFAVGTGVAKSFSAFGTAFSNIGKLFALK